MTSDSTCVMHASAEDRADFAARARAVFGEHDGFDDERRLVRADGAVFRGRLRGRTVQPREPSAGTIWIVDDASNSDEDPHPLAWTAEHDALTGLVSRAGSGSARRARAR
jgi:hypothetical protein